MPCFECLQRSSQQLVMSITKTWYWHYNLQIGHVGFPSNQQRVHVKTKCYVSNENIELQLGKGVKKRRFIVVC
jgi:hypothetical protein